MSAGVGILEFLLNATVGRLSDAFGRRLFLFASPIVNLALKAGVFLREGSLGHSVIDSLGRRSCIRRIPIRSNYGEVEYDDLQSGTRDYIDCSGTNVRSLHFRLTDDKGTVIPLETPLSFSLVFSPTHN